MNNLASIVTLGSYFSSELFETIEKSHKFIKYISNEWIFVLINKEEISLFKEYVERNKSIFEGLEIKYDFCSKGIAKSMNRGISITKNQWILMLHSGDYLKQDLNIFKKTRDILQKQKFNDILVFGSIYKNINAYVGKSNHFKKFRLPYELSIPHQSTFIARKVYEQFNYSEEFLSSMDYEFFLRCKLKGLRFESFPVYTTIYTLGGTSSNVFLSAKEMKLAIRKNIKNKLFRFYLANINLNFIVLRKLLFRYLYFTNFSKLRIYFDKIKNNLNFIL